MQTILAEFSSPSNLLLVSGILPPLFILPHIRFNPADAPVHRLTHSQSRERSRPTRPRLNPIQPFSFSRSHQSRRVAPRSESLLSPIRPQRPKRFPPRRVTLGQSSPQ
jgi:hypothetical protein